MNQLRFCLIKLFYGFAAIVTSAFLGFKKQWRNSQNKQFWVRKMTLSFRLLIFKYFIQIEILSLKIFFYILWKFQTNTNILLIVLIYYQKYWGMLNLQGYSLNLCLIKDQSHPFSQVENRWFSCVLFWWLQDLWKKETIKELLNVLHFFG